MRFALENHACSGTRGLDDKDDEPRGYAALALGNIAYTAGLGEADANTITRKLIRQLEAGGSYMAVYSALVALGDIGLPAREAIPAIKNRLSQSSQNIEAGYALARIDPNSSLGIDRLRRLLAIEDPIVSFNTCIVVGRLGRAAKDLAPDIRKHIKADNEYSAAVVERVLRQISGTTTPPSQPSR